MSELIPAKRALISVSDKTNLIPLAKKLAAYGVQIISTGGTAKALIQAGLPVTAIDEFTGFPEMMDGRLKTLHPRVHGALLAIRDNPAHVSAMTEHGIQAIDIVCVNLYPFEKTVANPEVADHEAIEQIDIGGPSMIRSASKNHRFVAVLTDPMQYEELMTDLDVNFGSTSLGLRRRLAAAAFARTASYDTAIAAWMSSRLANDGPRADAPSGRHFPNPLILRLNRTQELRYGENPHQLAAVYADVNCREVNVVSAKQLHGKELSYNNLNDAAAALELVKEFTQPAAAIIKHTNPCGCAVGGDLTKAFEAAYAGDPLAAFGGIVALNRIVDLDTAAAITSGQKFLEVILAPGYEPEALQVLTSRWKLVRLLSLGPLPAPSERNSGVIEYKSILGGMLAQQRDLVPMTSQDWQLVAGPRPSPDTLRDLELAWTLAKHVKSNAIVIVKAGALAGAGAGQMDRVESCRLAVSKSNVGGQNRSQGGVAGSDAFFPFRDGPDVLIAAGIRAIVQPGGSKRDDETIQACQQASISLYFTGRRHFRH